MTTRYISTPHGIINTELRRYSTIRKPEHYFKKYQGYGISLTEIKEMRRFGVNHIIIRYEGTNRNTIYIIKLEKACEGITYINNEDEQIIIPEKELNIIGTEIKWQKQKKKTQKNKKN